MTDPQIINVFEYIKQGAETLSYCTIILGSTYLGYKIVKGGVEIAIDYGRTKLSLKKADDSLEKIIKEDAED